MARPDNSDPSGLGNTPNWAFAWPGQPADSLQPCFLRLLRQALGPTTQGDLVESKGKQVARNGCTGHATGRGAGANVGPFIMNPEGVARLFGVDKMAEGPFPEHYDAVRKRRLIPTRSILP